MDKENIWNIPNALTFFRLIISFVTIFLIFAGFDIFYIIGAFLVGMLTDFFDGQIARRFKLTTEFGRKFDMIADRILMVGVASAFVIKSTATGAFSNIYILQIFLILSREIIDFPVIIFSIILGRKVFIPQVRWVAKITTFMQAITFPIILLSISYELFNFSLYLTVITSILGVISAFYYMCDVRNLAKNDRV